MSSISASEPVGLTFSEQSEFADSIRALLLGQNPDNGSVSLAVHPGDDMYNFGLDHVPDRDQATMAYFRAGMSIYDTATRLASWWWGDLDRIESWLDFAAGFGRSTRFLAHHLGPDRVWVGEVQADAVEFQRATFGVHGLLSTTDPADFRCDRRFDVIFVASLFSHLPEATFGGWLMALYERLTDGGVLIFSVLDERQIDDGVPMPDSGFRFRPGAEVAELDCRDYGVTFVSEAFVRRCVADHTDAGYVARLPQALTFQQDIYLVGRDASRGTPSLPPEPAGAVDVVRIDSDRIELQGWAADLSTTACEVTALLGSDVIGRAVTGHDRPDVAAHFHRTEPAFAQSGWVLDAPVADPEGRRLEQLLVKVVSSEGRQFILDCAPLKTIVERTNPAPSASAPTPAGSSRWPRRLQTAARLFREGGWRSVGRQAARKVRGSA